jgi:RNA polymerase sigma-70 factor, ECF subfamily
MNAQINGVAVTTNDERPDWPDAEDRDAIARIALGERSAFASFYIRFYPRLKRFLWRVIYRAELIDEIISDTMFAVWQQAATFRGQSLVSTWVIGIAYRHGCRSLRAQARSGVAAVDIRHSEHESSDGPLNDVETDDWLSKALATLPVTQRAVLMLTYYGGHSCDEIAELMECPVNTVKTRMFHARRKLRARLPTLAEPGKAVHLSARDDGQAGQQTSGRT